jgi:hypothetical protein
MYYAKGSSFAKHLTKNSTTFAAYFNEVKPESESLSLINVVLLNSNKFFGPSGVFLTEKTSLKFDIITEDREEIIKGFKLGLVAFKETPLGGCGSIMPCDKKAFGIRVACLSCVEAFISLSKLKNQILISEQKMNSNFDTKTVQYWQAKSELTEFLEYAIGKITKWLRKIDKQLKEYKENRDYLAYCQNRLQEIQI